MVSERFTTRDLASFGDFIWLAPGICNTARSPAKGRHIWAECLDTEMAAMTGIDPEPTFLNEVQPVQYACIMQSVNNDRSRMEESMAVHKGVGHYGAPITLDQAKKVMAAAEAKAFQNNWYVAIS